MPVTPTLWHFYYYYIVQRKAANNHNSEAIMRNSLPFLLEKFKLILLTID